MTKSELVERIGVQNPRLYQRDVEWRIDATLDEITAALSRGDRVELRGFGAFSVKRRRARIGRNPCAGAEVAILNKASPDLQDRKGNAGAPESGQCGLSGAFA